MDERPATQARYPCAVLKQSFLNGLSQIEKLEASAATTALRLEPCSLYEVAKSVITIISPQLKPGVEMLTAYPPENLQVKMDRTVLAQVLINLLQNAAANTSSGFVELSCSVTANSTSETSVDVALRVRDTGHGMSKEMQTKVFDRYQSIGGLGLGMYLTKLQVQQMGSSISVQSPWSRSNGEQHGTEFSFCLRLEVVSSSRASATARVHPSQEELPEPQLPQQLKARAFTAQAPPRTQLLSFTRRPTQASVPTSNCCAGADSGWYSDRRREPQTSRLRPNRSLTRSHPACGGRREDEPQAAARGAVPALLLRMAD